MDKIKIIFANRKDCFDKPGGDTVQMLKTKEYLEKYYPVEIEILLTPKEILSDKEAKIVHIFNLQTINETNKFINAARIGNKKVVLSTIYWNLLDTYYIKYLESLNISPIDIPDFFKLILIKVFNLFILSIPNLRKKYERYISKGLFGTKQYVLQRKQALINSDLLLPNSEEEMILCAKDFHLEKQYIENKSCIIPNATEFSEESINIENIKDNYQKLKNFILQVGRIEQIKNQLNLLLSLKDYPEIPIVFIGRYTDKKYFDKLKKIAEKRGNVFFIEQMPHNNLINFYKQASVHVLASFRESPGLVSLEAKAAGCPIVVSSKKYCPINYYNFDKYASICNPYDKISIKNAVFTAIKLNTNNPLPDKYKTYFSYNNVAKLTYNSYLSLLQE